MILGLFVLLVALAAGAVASVAGFGIGSFLTPAMSLPVGIELAVAAVAIPHAIGTTMRFWMLRQHLNRQILLSFGLTSAGGALAGALLHARASDPLLLVVFALLLIFSGTMGLAGYSRRFRFRGLGAWIAGAVSGLFGGMVGNQGGIRAAAMLGLHVPRDEFVATATAIALFVDCARLPVYLVHKGPELLSIWPLIAITTAGVVLGTAAGGKLLAHIPQQQFHRFVSALLLILGVLMLFRLGG